jgi:hypothetical protein
MKSIIPATAVLLFCSLSLSLSFAAQPTAAAKPARLVLAKHHVQRHHAHKHGKHRAPKHSKGA